MKQTLSINGEVFKVEDVLLVMRQAQAACGLAFDYGRELGNLELRQVLMDAEMMRNCDERAAEEIHRLRYEVKRLQAYVDSMRPFINGLRVTGMDARTRTLEVHAPSILVNGVRFVSPPQPMPEFTTREYDD